MNYKEIQNDVIRKYNIDMCDGTKCADDWSRTHAHWKLRRVCKWKQANSIQSTFTLLHEIGHIENHVAGDRRAESEYHATIWAMEEAKKYDLEVPEKIIDDYQEYIDAEKRRGERRGGSGYGNLDLWSAADELYRRGGLFAVARYTGEKMVLDNRRYTDYDKAVARLDELSGSWFSLGDVPTEWLVAMKKDGVWIGGV